MYGLISRSRPDCKPQRSSQNTAHPLLARAQHTIPASQLLGNGLPRSSAIAVTVSSPPSAAVLFLDELAPMLGVSAPSMGPALGVSAPSMVPVEDGGGGSAGAASGGSISMLEPLATALAISARATSTQLFASTPASAQVLPLAVDLVVNPLHAQGVQVPLLPRLQHRPAGRDTRVLHALLEVASHPHAVTLEVYGMTGPNQQIHFLYRPECHYCAMQCPKTLPASTSPRGDSYAFLLEATRFSRQTQRYCVDKVGHVVAPRVFYHQSRPDIDCHRRPLNQPRNHWVSWFQLLAKQPFQPMCEASLAFTSRTACSANPLLLLSPIDASSGTISVPNFVVSI